MHRGISRIFRDLPLKIYNNYFLVTRGAVGYTLNLAVGVRS